MANPVFDTLKAAKALKAAGFDDRQAEAVVATVGSAVNENLATRADLQKAVQPLATRQELDKAIQPLATRKELDKAFAAQDQRFDEKLETLCVRFDEKLESLSVRFDGKVQRVDGKIQQLDEKILSLRASVDEKIHRLEEKFEARFDSVATKVDLAELQHRMTVRLGSMMVAGIGVLALIIGLA